MKNNIRLKFMLSWAHWRDIVRKSYGILWTLLFAHFISDIDRKIRIIKPEHCSSLYYNYTTFSQFRFLKSTMHLISFNVIDVGAQGMFSDLSVF